MTNAGPSKTVTIAGATAEERGWAAQVMAASEPWQTLGRGLDQCRHTCSERADYELFVARLEGAPAGFILVHPYGVAGSPYIASIAVAPEFRGRGVGTLLVEFAERHFRSSARHIFLCVSSFNGGAARLYRRLGYTRVGEFADYVIEGASEILMHKRLRTP